MGLKTFRISEYKTTQNRVYCNLELSYQIFGPPIGSHPIVLIHHALTGNSDVASGQSGWWNTIVGEDKVIDLKDYTVVCIDILGNGYNLNNNMALNPKDFSLTDIAKLNWTLIERLNIDSIYACIGGSIGGGIAWEMAVQKPNVFQYLIPIASHWKATDWIIGHNYIQSQILEQPNGLELARMMAMMFYRTPDSFEYKFDSQVCSTYYFKVNSWLNHHGNRLKSRYNKASYQMMNHLLSTLNICSEGKAFEEQIKPLSSVIVQIGISSDLYFSAKDNQKTNCKLDDLNKKNYYFEIDSIHGHDAFLIEYKQLETILSPFFNCKNKSHENNKIRR